MGFIERFAEVSVVPNCKVRAVLDQLHEQGRHAERDHLVDVLASPLPTSGGRWSNRRLADGFAEENFPASENSIKRHREGKCGCGPEHRK